MMNGTIQEEIEKIKSEFIYKIIFRILWPIFPIGMEIAIRFLLELEIIFPNKSILVVTFIVPALYLPDYKDKISLTLLSMCCLLSATPFFCSIVSQKRLIFFVGLFLLLLYIILFTIFDYFSYRKKYSNLLGGRIW